MIKTKYTPKAKVKRALVGLLGWAVLLLGAVMIPYPGPGWVVVFVGLSILATEFDWAHNAHKFLHGKYDDWQAWIKRQPIYVKAIFWLLTGFTVVVTVWLLNGYGMIDTWLGLDQEWTHSPLSIFN